MNLREAAFHEASHACVSDALGCGPARIELWRVSRDGASWVRGRCHHYLPNTGDEQRLISLAGAVGEVLCGPCAGNSGEALLNVTLPLISAADAAGAGDFSHRDLDRCLALVRRLWPSIEARALLEISIITNRERAVAALSGLVSATQS